MRSTESDLSFDARSITFHFFFQARVGAKELASKLGKRLPMKRVELSQE